MKKIIALILAVFTFATCIIAQNPNHVYVNSYVKSNGTYVEGYYRTAPNNTINDNYSTYPNVNPYTGKQGTITPTYDYNDNPRYSTPTNTYQLSTPSYSNTNTGSNDYYYTYH